MPYIKRDRREEIMMQDALPETAGELNFCLTRVIRQYWLHRKNYAAANDIIGALEGAKLEFYRRVVAPYEDTKITENGDVW